MKIPRFEDLECWKEARILVNMGYKAINSREKIKKDYRLSGQVTNAIVSSMSNIAEGFSHHSNKEFVQFLFISGGSISKIQSIFYVALDQACVDKEVLNKIYLQVEKVSKVNSGLINYLLRNSKRNKGKISS
jgi:four helix bundle protein